jgi:hypothetical protein
MPVAVALLPLPNLVGKPRRLQLADPSERPLGTGPPIILLTRSLLI